MWRFRLTRSKEGFGISLEDSPVWAVLLEEIGDWAARRVLPAHKLCCEIPEWAWKIGWGEYDADDDFWENSLGRCCWRFSNWVESGFGAWQMSNPITTIQVPRSWVQRNFPDVEESFFDDLNEEI